MVALDGTVQPTVDELLSEGPAPFLTSESVYGSVVADSTTLIATIKFSSLTAGNSYVIYTVATDRGGYYSSVSSLSFSTLGKFSFGSKILLIAYLSFF